MRIFPFNVNTFFVRFLIPACIFVSLFFFLMMKLLTTISRAFVGFLFIFSGLIKANDPLGFSYKLSEYFEKFKEEWSVMGWLFDFMHEWALPLAMFIVVLEIVLGVAVLTGYKKKVTNLLLLLLIVFFTALTFVSAQFEWVRSCGCFGDAIPLTPWQSFIKDLVLLGLILVIMAGQKHIQEGEIDKPLYILFALCLAFLVWLSSKLNWYVPALYPAVIVLLYVVLNKSIKDKSALASTAIGLFSSCLFTYHAYAHLPFKDFRAYAIGKNIPEQMVAVPSILKYTYNLKDKASGEIIHVESFPENYELKYEYLNFDTTVIKAGIPAKIHDFVLMNADKSDYTGDVLENPDLNFLLVAYDLENTNLDVQSKIKSFSEQCAQNKLLFKGVTASTREQVEQLEKKYGQNFEYYFCDAVTLKTIIRSNPGLVAIKNGTIVGQWHYNDFTGFEEAMQVGR